MPEDKEYIEHTPLELKWLYLTFAAAFIGNPRKTLTEKALEQVDYDKLFEKWYNTRTDGIKSIASKLAGIEPDKINVEEPDKQSPEIKEAVERAEKLFDKLEEETRNKSRYMQALNSLSDIKYKKRHKEQTPEEEAGTKDLAVIYFFTIHEDLSPMKADKLTPEEKQEIREIFKRLSLFFEENHINNDTSPLEALQAFIKFAEVDSANIEKLQNQDITKIIKKKITEIEYPLDKVNSKLWGLIPNGEIIPLKAESDSDSSKGKQATTYLTLDLNEIDGAKLTASRPLTAYDKRVFIAVANLVEQGQNIITTAQIYKAMGYKTRPNNKDRSKLLNSLDFLSTIKIHIDNSEEAKLYNYERIKGSFYLLATEYIEGYKANGHIIEDAIHVIKYPDLFAFSKKRGQITKIPVSLLDSPISKTEANLQLEDYMFRRISRMRANPSITKRIKLETICTNCNITAKMQKSRLPGKIETLLDHYKANNYIKGYKINSDNVDITL